MCEEGGAERMLAQPPRPSVHCILAQPTSLSRGHGSALRCGLPDCRGGSCTLRRHWAGPLAAAVYLPLVVGQDDPEDPRMNLGAVMATIQDLYAR